MATLTDCTLSGNSGSPYSGAAGVFNSGTANLTMTDCTVSGNSGFGTGGLANSGTANQLARTGNASPPARTGDASPAFATLRRPLDWTFQVQVKGQYRIVSPIYK